MSNTHTLSKLYISDLDIEILVKPLRALFTAILARALRDIFKPTYSDHGSNKTKALYWIFEDDPDSITSFISICGHLDIDADKVRHKVFVKLSRLECDIPHYIKFNLGNIKVQSERPRG